MNKLELIENIKMMIEDLEGVRIDLGRLLNNFNENEIIVAESKIELLERIKSLDKLTHLELMDEMDYLLNLELKQGYKTLMEQVFAETNFDKYDIEKVIMDSEKYPDTYIALTYRAWKDIVIVKEHIRIESESHPLFKEAVKLAIDIGMSPDEEDFIELFNNEDILIFTSEEAFLRWYFGADDAFHNLMSFVLKMLENDNSQEYLWHKISDNIEGHVINNDKVVIYVFK